MEASQSVPELVAAAQANVNVHERQIAETLILIGDEPASDAQLTDIRESTLAIEALAIDIFAVFEARMQHHFKRGPFSRKLKTALLDAGQPDHADRVHQHYLVVNVLKHGTGASYRELRGNKSTQFEVKQIREMATFEPQKTPGLVDVTVPGFFDGLRTTILDAYQFLDAK